MVQLRTLPIGKKLFVWTSIDLLWLVVVSKVEFESRGKAISTNYKTLRFQDLKSLKDCSKIKNVGFFYKLLVFH